MTEIDYDDGATPEMLNEFKYVSNKESCELSYISPWSGSENKMILTEGKLQ
jgi:hypothetical protein